MARMEENGMPRKGTVRRVVTVIGMAVALSFPWMVQQNPYYLEIGFNFWLWCILGLSLNVILGGPGLYHLGQAALYGVGAYTTAILNTMFGIPVLWLLPVSAATAALFGASIARPILHLRGDYLLIVTVGFAEIVRIALRNNVFGITGGVNGILGIDRPELFGWVLTTPLHFYYYSLVMALVMIAVTIRLNHSRIGRSWRYIREDEVAAEATGIDTAHYKLLAFVVGSAMAGVAGNIYASKMTVIAPESFAFWDSVVMFAIVVLGGPGSVPGVLLGTFGMIVLPQLFRGLESYRMLVFGAAMVLMMIFRPQGLWPSSYGARISERRLRKGGKAADGAA